LITRLRILFGYGQTMGYPNCEKLKNVLAEMRFKATPPRKVVITYRQVVAFIAKAHELNEPGLALAQALQFEGTLRQIDVIGEWLPDPERPSGTCWANGLLWQHIRDYVSPHFPPGTPRPNVLNGLDPSARIRDKIAASKRKGMCRCERRNCGTARSAILGVGQDRRHFGLDLEPGALELLQHLARRGPADCERIDAAALDRAPAPAQFGIDGILDDAPQCLSFRQPEPPAPEVS